MCNHYGFRKEQFASGDFDPQIFNLSLDGTKSALERAAVANDYYLCPPSNRLAFPLYGTHEHPEVFKPNSDAGRLEKKGTVEVVSCGEEDR